MMTEQDKGLIISLGFVVVASIILIYYIPKDFTHATTTTTLDSRWNGEIGLCSCEKIGERIVGVTVEHNSNMTIDEAMETCCGIKIDYTLCVNLNGTFRKSGCYRLNKTINKDVNITIETSINETSFKNMLEQAINDTIEDMIKNGEYHATKQNSPTDTTTTIQGEGE